MRVIVAGEKHWHADDLAENVVTRLLKRYGLGLVIVHGGDCGVDHSFALACAELGVEVDLYLADFSQLGDFRFKNREMIRRGAGLCLILQALGADEASLDLARQAIEAGIPTYLIESEEGKPRRLKAGDIRLE